MKVKEHQFDSYEIKWRGVFKDYETTVAKYEKWWQKTGESQYFSYVILVNALTDEGEFIEVIL